MMCPLTIYIVSQRQKKRNPQFVSDSIYWHEPFRLIDC